jgi:hypothetical protein
MCQVWFKLAQWLYKSKKIFSGELKYKDVEKTRKYDYIDKQDID